MSSKSAAVALVNAARALEQSGINHGTSGNVSLRMDDGMLITPSGVRCVDLDPDRVPWVSWEGEVEGPYRPSSEWKIHRDIYRHRPEAGAVVHSHSDWCMTLACLGRPIPAFHYMVAVAGGRSIRCAEYATFGTAELSRNVLDALVNRKACLMANHGMVCLDKDLDRAVALAGEVEKLAMAYGRCLMIGEPRLLGDEEMKRVLKKFRGYGQPRNR